MRQIIEAEKVKKSYGKKTLALRGANFRADEGEIVAIMGPSGSGKSTLLHCLAGILRPDDGMILFRGINIGNLSDAERSRLRREKFGFVFQFSQLVPELSALDNVALPLLLNKIKKAEAYSRAKEWLGKVGMTAIMQQLPGELSGGQAQRVAMARAMVIEPEILFADEPTGSLDSLNSEKMMELITKTARETGTTVIMVTHEARIAAYADREVIVRDGVVIEGER